MSSSLVNGLYLFALLIISLLLFSCKKENKVELENLPLVQVVDSLVIHLDDETPNNFTSPQVINKGGKSYLLNTFLAFNFIKLFNLESGICEMTLQFPSDGPNKMHRINGSYFLDSLRFLVIDDLDNIYTGDYKDSLQIQKIISGRKYKEQFQFTPIISNTRHPVIELDKNVFLFSDYFQNRLGRKTFNILDVENKKLRQVLDIPFDYIIGFFGTLDFNTWNYTFNKHKNHIAVSFPNLDSIFLYNLNLELLGKYRAASSAKKSPIKKIVSDDWDVTKRNESPKILIERIKSNFVYWELLFDSKNDLYYRLVGHPIPIVKIENEDPVESRIRHFSIMVMDSEFQFVKEWSIPYNKYNIQNVCYFVYNGYLFIQRLNDKEDEVIFDKINLSEF